MCGRAEVEVDKHSIDCTQGRSKVCIGGGKLGQYKFINRKYYTKF